MTLTTDSVCEYFTGKMKMLRWMGKKKKNANMQKRIVLTQNRGNRLPSQ